MSKNFVNILKREARAQAGRAGWTGARTSAGPLRRACDQSETKGSRPVKPAQRERDSKKRGEADSEGRCVPVAHAQRRPSRRRDLGAE